MVRGFRIKRQKDNTTDVCWKIDPALESEWRGAGGFPNTAGFYMLKSKPQGVPDFVIPKECTPQALDKAKTLKKDAMRECLRSQDLEPCVDWVYEAETTSKIPIYRYLEDQAPSPEWGRMCEVGAVEGKRGNLRVIDEYWDMSLPPTRKSMWSLPICPNGSHLDATTNHFHYSTDKAVIARRRLPSVRYRNEKRDDCEVGGHPNNVDGGWVAEETEEEEDGIDPSNNEDEKEDGGQKGPPAVDPGPLRERFEEDFSKCKKGSICVGLAQTSEGPTPYLFAGKILSVDESARTFTMQPYRCTMNPWRKESVRAAWHRQPGEPPEEQPHYAVMAYTKKMKQDHKMPAPVITSVERRDGIVWSA
jgi:hypothetical protein